MSVTTEPPFNQWSAFHCFACFRFYSWRIQEKQCASLFKNKISVLVSCV